MNLDSNVPIKRTATEAYKNKVEYSNKNNEPSTIPRCELSRCQSNVTASHNYFLSLKALTHQVVQYNSNNCMLSLTYISIFLYCTKMSEIHITWRVQQPECSRKMIPE